MMVSSRFLDVLTGASVEARVVSFRRQSAVREAAIDTPVPLALCLALEKLMGGRSGTLVLDIKGKTW